MYHLFEKPEASVRIFQILNVQMVYAKIASESLLCTQTNFKKMSNIEGSKKVFRYF